jgi:hypothetical protein
LKPLFLTLAHPLLSCFIASPLSNTAALRFFSQACQTMKNDADILQLVQASFNQVIECIMGSMQFDSSSV